MRLDEQLRALLEVEDSRTIEEMIEEDSFEEVVIEKADRSGESTTISWDHGTTTSVKGPEVRVGDRVRIYPDAGFGTQRYGWALNGKVIEWLTPWERVAERISWLAAHDRRQRESYVREKPELDEKYEALSEPLRARIDRFRERPGFRIEGEAYELFCCAEAEKIAAFLRPRVEAGEDAGDVVREFYALPWAEQVKAGVDGGHSGNTFGGACQLAAALLAGGKV